MIASSHHSQKAILRLLAFRKFLDFIAEKTHLEKTDIVEHVVFVVDGNVQVDLSPI